MAIRRLSEKSEIMGLRYSWLRSAPVYGTVRNKEKKSQLIGHNGMDAHKSYRVKHDIGWSARRVFRGIRASDLLAEVEALKRNSCEVPARAVGIVGSAEPAPKVWRNLVVVL